MSARPWNWCHKCRQPVDCDDVGDGSVVRCWGCKREFTCVAFTDGSWALLSESQQKRMNAAANKRHREAPHD